MCAVSCMLRAVFCLVWLCVTCARTWLAGTWHRRGSCIHMCALCSMLCAMWCVVWLCVTCAVTRLTWLAGKCNGRGWRIHMCFECCVMCSVWCDFVYCVPWLDGHVNDMGEVQVSISVVCGVWCDSALRVPWLDWQANDVIWARVKYPYMSCVICAVCGVMRAMCCVCHSVLRVPFCLWCTRTQLVREWYGQGQVSEFKYP